MSRPTPLPKVQREIALRVRAARTSAGLTQEQAAARASIGYKRWQEIERGQVNLTLRTLHRIASALGVDFWELTKKA